MNIVLDMDETLIYGDGFTFILPRPHLKEFLIFCFEKFQNVSIWTAASEKWFNKVDKEIFQPILKEINRAFDFVYTGEKCTIVWVWNEFYGQSLMKKEKRLRKLHRSRLLIDYTIENTIIVDDTPETFRKNYGNGIQVKEWDFQNHNDRELLMLKTYLEQILIPHYEKFLTIRDLEKRNWKMSIIKF